LPIPTWSVGQVLASADVNSWFVPLFAFKAANTSRSSTTSPTSDPDLQLAVAANGYYQLNMMVGYEGANRGTGDLQWQFSLPSGGLRYAVSMQQVSTGNGVTNWFGPGSTQAASNGAGNGMALNLQGLFENGSSAGTFAFQWAQNTSSGTPTIVYSFSYMMLRRVS
jgi:hypothetical protein